MNAASSCLVSTLWTLRSRLQSSDKIHTLKYSRLLLFYTPLTLDKKKKKHFRPLTSGFHWCDKLRTHFNHFIAQTFNGNGYFLHAVAGSNDSAVDTEVYQLQLRLAAVKTHPPCRHTHFLPHSIHLCSSNVLKGK